MRNERGFIDIENVIGIGFIAIVIVAIIMGVWWNWKISYGNIQTIEITVEDKYIKRSGSEDDKYLVVDTDGNTYKITDLKFLGKWNSTDLYNQLKIGNTYKITTSGIRNGFMSMYPNINKIEELED